MAKTFNQTVLGWKLKHFTSKELAFLGVSHYDPRASAYALNELPPRELWSNIELPALIADELRAQFGSAIRITSAYRNPAYNKAVGGGRRSQHLKYTALDLYPVNGEARRLYDLAIALRRSGAFKGGIGRYRSFVHIDTRGNNATWKG